MRHGQPLETHLFRAWDDNVGLDDPHTRERSPPQRREITGGEDGHNRVHGCTIGGVLVRHRRVTLSGIFVSTIAAPARGKAYHSSSKACLLKRIVLELSGAVTAPCSSGTRSPCLQRREAPPHAAACSAAKKPSDRGAGHARYACAAEAGRRPATEFQGSSALRADRESGAACWSNGMLR